MSKPRIALDAAGVQPISIAESTQRSRELDSFAQEAFESLEEAAEWMRRPHPMLNGEAPRDCAKSSSGAERVKAILVAIKFGGVA